MKKNRCDEAIMNDEHNALNEFARPDSRAIPPPGHALLGEGHLCSNHWSVLIHPSVWDGYYFVTVWSSHEKDEGSTMDYLKRTIRADYLEFALDQLCPGWQA